jgi:anthranilate synthase/aminodeoxychorismate synthase-like glutamine amidotransferase
MIFLVDNYDSFTFNLAQALSKLGAEVEVARNDAFEPRQALSRRPRAVVLSPGPGRPERAGRMLETIAAAEEEGVALLGVCLGHQGIAAFHGGIVQRAPEPRHGKASAVSHDGTGLYAGLPSPFPAARYHSLVVRREGLPEDLSVTAVSDDGLIMGLAHRRLPVFGVQFHPESILTPDGERLLANFLRIAGAA